MGYDNDFDFDYDGDFSDLSYRDIDAFEMKYGLDELDTEEICSYEDDSDYIDDSDDYIDDSDDYGIYSDECKVYKMGEKVLYSEDIAYETIRRKCDEYDLGCLSEFQLDNLLARIEFGSGVVFEEDEDLMWRNRYTYNFQLDIAPVIYFNEEDYIEACFDAVYDEKVRYAWREMYENSDCFGLDTRDYEKYADFLNDYLELSALYSKHSIDEEGEYRIKNIQDVVENMGEDAGNIHMYCRAILPYSKTPYTFLFENMSLKLGDEIIVPVGERNKRTKAIVVGVGRCLEMALPYPIEETKQVIEKVDNKQYE